MSLDFYLTEVKPTEVFEINITHNVGRMASKAGIYEALWCSEGNKAKDILPYLIVGLAYMAQHSRSFAEHEAENGWGTYPQFIAFVEKVARACAEHPEAEINISK